MGELKPTSNAPTSSWTPHSERAGTILLGSFNPKIFHPVWFSSQGIIRSQEAEGASIKIINDQVADFSLDWAGISVLHGRFQIVCDQRDGYTHLFDFVVRTFQILSHTPVRAIGINYEAHFSISDIAVWHGVGDFLAPKGFWAKFVSNPGLEALVIQGEREDEFDGYLQIRVQPSKEVTPGIYIMVNDHFEVKDSPGLGCAELITKLMNTANDSLERSRMFMNRIMEETTKHPRAQS